MQEVLNRTLNELRNLVAEVDTIRNDLNEQDVKDTCLRIIELFGIIDAAASNGAGWPSEWVVPHA